MSKSTMTIAQMGHIVGLFEKKGVTESQYHELNTSGLLTDLLDAKDYKRVDRKAFRACLRAQTRLSEPQDPPLLEVLKKIPVSGADRFEPSKVIVVDTSLTAAAKIGYIDPKVREIMAGVVEENIPATDLTLQRLARTSKLKPIFEELGDRAQTAWKHFFEMLSRQPRGEQGDLKVDGCANFAFLPDKKGKLWAVFAFWSDWGDGDRWKLNAYPIVFAVDWSAGVQFLSGDSERTVGVVPTDSNP
ncbi:MAG: hypothetical protein AAB563_00400 [Patescibacteria group bacterium]